MSMSCFIKRISALAQAWQCWYIANQVPALDRSAWSVDSFPRLSTLGSDVTRAPDGALGAGVDAAGCTLGRCVMAPLALSCGLAVLREVLQALVPRRSCATSWEKTRFLGGAYLVRGDIVQRCSGVSSRRLQS